MEGPVEPVLLVAGLAFEAERVSDLADRGYEGGGQRLCGDPLAALDASDGVQIEGGSANQALQKKRTASDHNEVICETASLEDFSKELQSLG